MTRHYMPGRGRAADLLPFRGIIAVEGVDPLGETLDLDGMLPSGELGVFETWAATLTERLGVVDKVEVIEIEGGRVLVADARIRVDWPPALPLPCGIGGRVIERHLDEHGGWRLTQWQLQMVVLAPSHDKRCALYRVIDGVAPIPELQPRVIALPAPRPA